MMNPSVMSLQHRLVLELSVGLLFDQRQAQWRIDLFWRQLQALSARSCRSLARNLNYSGYTQSTCSQGGGPCEGFEKRWRTTMTVVVCIFRGGAFLFTATPRTRKEFLSRQSLLWLRGRAIGALRAERHALASAEWASCFACHELLCSRAFLFIVLRSAQHPRMSRFLQIFR